MRSSSDNSVPTAGQPAAAPPIGPRAAPCCAPSSVSHDGAEADAAPRADAAPTSGGNIRPAPVDAAPERAAAPEEAKRTGNPMVMPFASADGISLDEVIDAIGDAICTTDSAMVFKGANHNFARFYGLPSPELLIGKSAFDVYPDFKKSVFYEMCEETVRTGKTTTRMGRSLNVGVEMVLRCYKDRVRDDRYVLVVHRLQEGGVKDSYSSVDDLTSLPNRWRFETDLDNLRGFGKNAVALLLVDISRFTQINEVLGVDAGDRFLMEVAARIKMSVQKNDRVYRQGDDRFLVLCPEPETLDARRHAITAALNTSFALGGEQYVPDVRMGLHLTTYEETPAQAMIHVERALGWAKKNKEPYALYDRSMSASTFQPGLAQELRTALREGQLQVVYQPQIDLIDERVVGAEALVRWNHPVKGVVPPDHFLGYAEDSGLIREIDDYVARSVFHYQKGLIAQGIRVPISVNLSSLSVCTPALVDKFAAWFQETGVPSDLVGAEITETSMMQDAATSQRVVEGLKGLGMDVAIDDFGTGYSSMQYLARYPSTTLKIDRSFISQMESDPALCALVKSMITLAHSLRIQVVAEGVERSSEVDLLRQGGCDIVQGYVFSRPLSEPDFVAFVRAQGVGSMASDFR